MHLPFDNLETMEMARHPLAFQAAVAGIAGVVGVAAWMLLRKRPTAAQMEERRRHQLARFGRIVDGTVSGVEPTELDPRLVFYQYRVAGVTYECSQDVTGLGLRVHNVHLDFPVQVRYARANPGNSIVMDEGWNGLWTADTEKDPDATHGNQDSATASL